MTKINPQKNNIQRPRITRNIAKVHNRFLFFVLKISKQQASGHEENGVKKMATNKLIN